MIAPHLPALQVVLPLIASPLCILVRRGWFAWALAALLSWTALAIAGMLLHQVLTDGPISYELGNWAAPWGIEYRVDALSAFVLLIVSGIGAVTILFAPKSVAIEISEDRINLFYAMYLLTLAGLLGIAITGDAFNLFVFLEISSLSTYTMISLGTDRRALSAAYRYLILGTLGATFYVLGVGMMYQMTGTLNMADLAERLPAVAETRTIIVAVGLITVGIGLKVGLFPLHLWLPNAYAYAPSMVSAFIAATSTKVAVYVLLRLHFTVFGIAMSDRLPVHIMLVGLGLAAALTMSAVAVYQTDTKKLLAYSSVAQIGYMVIGVGIATTTGVMAGILHLFNHALMKGALFLALGCVFYRIRSVRLDDLAGIGRTMPYTMAAFVVGGFSLIGIPLTVGFVSKWYLITAALEIGWWPVAVLILVSSLIAVLYIWRVVEVAYFRPRPADAPRAEEVPWVMLAPMWVLVLANIYFGIDTDLTVGTARLAADFLVAGARP